MPDAAVYDHGNLEVFLQDSTSMQPTTPMGIAFSPIRVAFKVRRHFS
jgi:hypothetical protein